MRGDGVAFAVSDDVEGETGLPLAFLASELFRVFVGPIQRQLWDWWCRTNAMLGWLNSTGGIAESPWPFQRRIGPQVAQAG